jgi:hypothetical protein
MQSLKSFLCVNLHIIFQFKLSNLELDYHARDKIIRLLGDRYHQKTEMVTIEVDRRVILRFAPIAVAVGTVYDKYMASRDLERAVNFFKSHHNSLSLVIQSAVEYQRTPVYRLT